MPPVVVTGRHRPHEVVFLAYSALLGLAFVVGAKPPGTVEQLLPDWVLWVWYVLLLISGAVGIVSMPVRDPYVGLTLERAAMWGQSAAFSMYSVAIFAVGGQSGVFAGGLCLSLAGASVWRMRQIRRELTLVREAAGGER